MYFVRLGLREALDRLAWGRSSRRCSPCSPNNQHMPGNGRSGIARRDLSSGFPELPVMMVTAYGDDERRRKASDLGALDFPHKAGGFSIG